MAHADYNCCAVCDSKLAYNSWDARTKEEVCASCAVALVKRGVEATTGEALLAWIKATDPAAVLRVLAEVGYCGCFYDNDVDAFVKTLATPTAAPPEDADR